MTFGARMKGLTKKQLFLPIFSMLLVMLVNIIFDLSRGNAWYNFFTINITNGILYGRLIDILNRGSEAAILAIGMTMVVSASAGTDISVGSVMSLAGGVCCVLLAGFGLSLFLFHERCNKWQLVAILFAVAGVLISVFQFGRFPAMAIALCLAFAVYGALKKYAQVEPLVSIAAETLMMAPFALLFLLFFRTGANAVSINARDFLLLAASGAVTAMPMILYSLGVIHLPFYMLGFFQYVSPSISLLCGLFMGETLTRDKLITFLFLWAGLAIFSLSTLKKPKAQAQETLSKAE